MATRTIAKSDKWNRPTYQRKDFDLATLPEGIAWAKGCELCKFGRRADGTFCTCRAGQGRARLAAGLVVYDEDADSVRVPTAMAAYGGVE